MYRKGERPMRGKIFRMITALAAWLLAPDLKWVSLEVVTCTRCGEYPALTDETMEPDELDHTDFWCRGCRGC
jgi:hypothetical protein